MFAWVKVVISRCKYAGQDHVGSTREQEVFQPETALPLYGMELLEPRVMLSGTGLLSAPQLIDALPSRSMVAITGFDTSGGISTEGRVVRAGDRSALDIVIEEDEMSDNEDHWKYVLNEAVLGRSDVDNALKGMSVVVDDDEGLAYITGIMTDAVSVIDLESHTLDRIFYLTDHSQATKTLAFDSMHRRLWAISNKTDASLWIIDPDTEEVISNRDISSDIMPKASSYPVGDAVVDSRRELLYLLLNDVSGNRVAVYDTSLHSVGNILVGQEIRSLRWDDARDALLAMTAPHPESEVPTKIFILPQGAEASMAFIEPDLGTSTTTKPPSEFTFEPSGDFFLAGQDKLWRIDATTGNQVWEILLPYGATAIEHSGNELGVLHQYGSMDSNDIFVSRLSTFNSDTGAMLNVRMARFESSRMDSVAGAGTFVVGNGGDASISIFSTSEDPATNVKVGTAAEDVLVTPDGERMLVLNRLGGSQLIEYELDTGSSRVFDTVAWPVRMIQRPADEKLFIFSHFEPKVEVRDLNTLEVLREISLVSHGVTASYSDTLSDMTADPDANLLVALQCEQGKVAIIDGASESVLAVVDLGGAKPGTGLGRMNAAVDTSDPGNRRIFVYLADDDRIYRLEESNGFVPQASDSAAVSISENIKKTYGFRAVYYSPSLDTVFAWNTPIHPDTLVAGSAVEGVERFIGETDALLYAQHQVSAGVNRIESLVAIDSTSLETLHEQILAETMGMDSKVHLDLGNGRVAFTRSAYSEAHLTKIEYTAIEVTEELNFVPDSGVRLEGGTIPEVGIDPDTGTVYLYYVVGPDGYVVTSEDGGLDFSGVAPSPVQPDMKPFDPRGVLMTQVDQDGLPVWREFVWKNEAETELGYFTSLISNDGVQYQLEEGVRYDPPNTDNVGVYTAYTTADGQVGLMYIGDMGTETANVRLAYSDDNGQSFALYDDNPLGDAGTHDDGLNQRDPAAIVLADGSLRIFTMVQGGPLAPHPGVRSVTSIYSFTSTDNGLTFTEDPGVRLEPEDFTEFHVWSLNDPSVIPLSDGRYRMYVAGLISEFSDGVDARWVILSATTTTRIASDFDTDGDVDGDDFLIWQNNFPTFDGTASRSSGDADGNGKVDGDDFLVWQNHFPFPAALASLEEPSHSHDQKIEQSSAPVVQLDYVTTDEMEVGTHRPEVLLTEDGKEIILVVVHPKILEDGTLVKHQVHFFDAETGEKSRDSFDIAWETEEYGEPADHRALLIDGELVVVYQSLVFDPDSSPGAGPAEQYALNQSLMLARYSIEGEELFRGPIVAHVTDFDEDNFPDHCLVPLENSLLVSTGSTDRIKFREVSDEGEVLNTYEVSTLQISSDFDGDGDVDGNDFLVWQNNFPTFNGAASRSSGDADGNGNVDGDDFLAWQNHFPLPAGSHSSEIRSLSSIGNSLLRVGDQVLMFAESRIFSRGESGISLLELDSEYQPTELIWLSQNGQERTFPTGNLHYDGYTFVTYDARDTQDGPVGPEDAPFHPRLMILDETLNVIVDMEIGTGAGFAHVHPTMTMVDGDLVIGWSMQAEGYDHRVPQVQLERYTLDFSPDDETRVTQNLPAG